MPCHIQIATGGRSRAFTLIELLVVIAIIALLIGILMPALGKARDEGRKIQCLANLKSLGTAVQGYFNDSDGVLPWIEPIAGADENENSVDLFEVLERYLDAARPRREDPNDFDSNNWIVDDPYRCPSDRGGLDSENVDPAWQSYGISYLTPAQEIYVALELLGAIDSGNPDEEIAGPERWKGQRALSRTYDVYANRGERLPIMLDFDRFHANSNNDGRNALFWDGSAAVYEGDPPAEQIEEFFAQVLQLCNFGG